MTLALYVIASTVMVLVLSARLRSAREELARARQEPGSAQATDRDEQAAHAQAVYTQAIVLSLACLLAGMAAWYATPQRSARPAGAGRAGNTAGAGTDRGTAE
jgi:hypothetical protein